MRSGRSSWDGCREDISRLGGMGMRGIYALGTCPVRTELACPERRRRVEATIPEVAAKGPPGSNPARGGPPRTARSTSPQDQTRLCNPIGYIETGYTARLTPPPQPTNPAVAGFQYPGISIPRAPSAISAIFLFLRQAPWPLGGALETW